MNRKNLLLGFIIGGLIGALSLPVVQNLELPKGPANLIKILAILSPFLSVIGLAIASFLSRWFRIFWQIAKFVLVGALNTLVDFAVLNVLITLSGTASGLYFSVFKGASFVVAVINSYFWNKYWTFESQEQKQGKEFLEFLVVSVLGFGLNVGVASFVVNVVGPQWGISPVPWANIGALVATVFSLTWNFVGYKFIVFKR